MDCVLEGKVIPADLSLDKQRASGVQHASHCDEQDAYVLPRVSLCCSSDVRHAGSLRHAACLISCLHGIVCNLCCQSLPHTQFVNNDFVVLTAANRSIGVTVAHWK